MMKAERELYVDEAERQQLTRRLLVAQEQERRRIALEMHDDFGQHLSALTLKLSALRRTRDSISDFDEELAQVEALARQLDTELDRLVSRLRPPVLDEHGVIAALETYVKRWSEEFGVQAELHANGLYIGRLGGEVDVAVYRIVQEALQNIAKHAHARSVAVLIDRHADHLSVIVEDDGTGFDVEHPLRPSRRFGLIGMHDRAMQLGGTFDIESLPGRGTTVAVRLPLEKTTQADRG
jgi:signal transduction histidine kinase